jgi:hypothetical protein
MKGLFLVNTSYAIYRLAENPTKPCRDMFWNLKFNKKMTSLITWPVNQIKSKYPGDLNSDHTWDYTKGVVL